MDGAIHEHVASNMGISADLKIFLAKKIPGRTQEAIADNSASGSNPPACPDVFAGFQVAIAPDRPGSLYILSRFDECTGTDTTPSSY